MSLTGNTEQNPFDGTNGYPSRKRAVQTALGVSGFAPVKRLPRSGARALTCAEFFTGAENPAAHSVLLCTTETQCPRFAPSQLILKPCFLFLLKSFYQYRHEAGNAVSTGVWRRQTPVEHRTRISDVQTLCCGCVRPYRGRHSVPMWIRSLSLCR